MSISGACTEVALIGCSCRSQNANIPIGQIPDQPHSQPNEASSILNHYLGFHLVSSFFPASSKCHSIRGQCSVYCGLRSYIMEAVGVAASIAGILSIAGHTIDGLVKLRQFFNSAKGAPKKVRKLLVDIGGLNSTLCQVQPVLDTIRDKHGHPHWNLTAIVDELLDDIKVCEEDVREWTAVAQGLDPGSWTGLKAFFRRAKVAAGKDLFDEFRDKISGHRQKVSLSLSILGRREVSPP